MYLANVIDATHGDEFNLLDGELFEVIRTLLQSGRVAGVMLATPLQFFFVSQTWATVVKDTTPAPFYADASWPVPLEFS